ncbi:MAG: amidohydrolase [Anaerolineaceae bacterium]|nr:amidohydrolase [Anaerolineaceae bacterium]
MKSLIYNAKRIHTPKNSGHADSILINGKHIEAIGEREMFLPEIRKGIRQVDAEQAVILPGFIDAHNHFCYMAEGTLKIDLGGLFDKNQIFQKIRENCQKIPEDKPILCCNWEYDNMHKDIRITDTELDAIVRNREIHIQERTGHLSVTNKYTLAHAGIEWQNSNCCCAWSPSEFTGEICGKVNSMLSKYFTEELFSPENLKLCLKNAERTAHSKGVTGIHVICNTDDFPILYDFQDCLALDLTIFTETKDVQKIHSLGLRQIGGCGAVMVDGDTSAETAAFLEPYTNNPDNYGILFYRDDELYDYIRAAHSRDMQIGLHCVGDAASDQMIRTIARVQAEDPRPLRHRIEHFEFSNDDMIRRVKDLGICLSVQPAFNHLWPHTDYYIDLGEKRVFQADRIASLVKAGIHVCFGSDCPVTPCDPLLAIHSAVNHSNPAERIDVDTAIRCQTRESAYCGNYEHERGSIETGKIADLVFLEEDPLTVDKEAIRDIHVLRTVTEGQSVFLR